MFPYRKTLLLFVLIVHTVIGSTFADEVASDRLGLKPDKNSKRWLFLCCGLAGDQQHHERLTDACKKIVKHAAPSLSIANERIRVLAGDVQMMTAIQETSVKVEQCTQENIRLGVQWLAKNAAQQDETWIIFLGHAHLYGNSSQFNIQGRDIDQRGFSEVCAELKQDRQVFVITTPVSGFWTKPLAHRNRVVITATEPGLEFTGTEMPYAIADVLAGQGEHQNLEDIDADGTVSLLDLYLAVNLEIEGRFRSMERLKSEHAQLDDNGDGKGSEVQAAYLPKISKVDKSVSKPVLPSPISTESLDGFLSRHIRLKST